MKPSKFDKHKLNVLLVENDSDQVTRINEILNDDAFFDYNIIHVVSIEETQKKIIDIECKFQLIILNLNLPDSEGNITLARVQTLSAVPIMVLTDIDKDNKEQEFTALKLGAEEYLVKGKYTSGDLIDAVHHAIRRHKRILKVEQERSDLHEIINLIKEGNLDAILESTDSSHIIPLLEDHIVQELLEEVKKQHIKLKNLSTRDTLTQLYNRVEFKSRSEEALSFAKRYHRGFALFFIDVDNFKDINDTYGHEVGDKVLKKLAETWRNCLREEDVLGRLGGDEFGLIMPLIKSPEEAGTVANKLIKSLNKPLLISNKPIKVRISIGIACYPEAANNASDLQKHADVAMYRAKKKIGSHFQYYTKALQKAHLQRKELLRLLRCALENNEFHLVYQPIVNLKTQEMTGMEALIRWENKKAAKVGPSEFIPLAEEFGLIIDIGEWVIKEAIQKYSQWVQRFEFMGNVSINLSIEQLLTKNMAAKFKKLLLKHKLDPKNIFLELTETTVMADLESTKKTLQQFSKYGLNFSIDDFGTGYSSMNHLKLLPLAEIKIDRSFTQDITSDPNNAAIVISIISLAKTLGLQVVAEGIEKKEQLDFLVDHGCEKGQGYYFSYPLRDDDMTNYLIKQEKIFKEK